MTQEQLELMRKASEAAGGLNNYVLYLLVFFCMAVVWFLCRDYIKNHDLLIRVVSENTQAMNALSSKIDQDECQYRKQ